MEKKWKIDERKNAYGSGREWTRHLECGFLQDKCKGLPLEISPRNSR